MTEYKIVMTNINESPKVLNEYIQQARDEKYKYIFLQQKDLLCNDQNVYTDYIKLMKTYNVSTTYYGYYKEFNRMFNNPNPGVVIRVNDDLEVYINRFVCSAMICIDLEKVKFNFNENLKTLWYNLFLVECVHNKLIPFNGFYFDIPKSWERIIEINDGSEFKIDTVAVDVDRKLIGEYLKDKKIENVPNMSVNPVFDFLKEIHDERKV